MRIPRFIARFMLNKDLPFGLEMYCEIGESFKNIKYFVRKKVEE